MNRKIKYYENIKYSKSQYFSHFDKKTWIYYCEYNSGEFHNM